MELRLKHNFPPPQDLSSCLLNITPHLYLPRIEIHIAEHCNLNCKGCTHFSTIADAEFLPVTEFENEIKRISELTNKIGLINILGGEPLLNPDCTKYLKIARKYFPETEINLVSFLANTQSLREIPAT